MHYKIDFYRQFIEKEMTVLVSFVTSRRDFVTLRFVNFVNVFNG